MSFSEKFWSHADVLAGSGVEEFDLFSIPHFIWIAIVSAGIALYTFAYRKSGEKGRDNLRKAIAVFLILFEFFKISVIALNGAPVADSLPLHICSLAIFMILFDAMWFSKNGITGQFLVYEFMLGALITLLLPQCVIYPPYSFYVIHFFLIHGAIAAYIFARVFTGEIRPRYVGIWQTLLAMYIQIIPVYFLDKAYDKNYMFLLDHWGNPALKLCWDLSGGKGGFPYIIALSVLAVSLMHIVYLCFKIVERILKKGR